MQYQIVGFSILAVVAAGMVLYQVANPGALDWWYFLPVLLVVVLGVLLFQESAEWETFKIDHACKVVAKVQGSVYNTVGVGPKGSPNVGIAVAPGKTGWLCDDGVTYYR